MHIPNAQTIREKPDIFIARQQLEMNGKGLRKVKEGTDGRGLCEFSMDVCWHGFINPSPVKPGNHSCICDRKKKKR